MDFQTVSGMLRLGRKYGIESFCHEAQTRLEDFFPSTLRAYDAISEERFLSEDPNDEVSEFATIHMHRWECPEAIRLLQATGLSQCLPCAFYCAAQLGEEALVEAVEKRHLSLENLKRCLKGIVHLRNADMVSVKSLILGQRSRACKTPAECIRAGRAIVSSLLENKKLSAADALMKGSWIHSEAEGPTADNKLCTACVNFHRGAHEAERQKTWGSLKEFFDLTKGMGTLHTKCVKV